MRRILTIVGTRPEAIKLAPVILELQSRPDEFESRVCATAQHREMLDQVLKTFSIEPDVDLDIMEVDQGLPELTSRLMHSTAAVIEAEAPDAVVVQGDTTTVMVASLAAFYAGVAVAHVEAGLRSHDISSPFPEETNRRVVSILATYHFAPTAVAEARLIEEGIDPERVLMTGNTVIDALEIVRRASRTADAERILARVGGRRMVLVTAHRRENFGEGMVEICNGIKRLLESHDDVVAVYPVHMNTNVRAPVERILGGEERVILEEPLDYPTLAQLLDACHLVLTDSGGVREEAPALGKPVLVMRTETERPEGIEAGTARLVGPKADRIVAEGSRLLDDAGAYEEMARAVSPYGDGRAASRIVARLANR